jgi:hypothetical protein
LEGGDGVGRRDRSSSPATEAARASVAEAPAPRASGGGCWTEEVRAGGRHRRLEGGAWGVATDSIQMRTEERGKGGGMDSGEVEGRGGGMDSREEEQKGGAAAVGIWGREIRILVVFISDGDFLSGHLSGRQKSGRASGRHYGPEWRPRHY